MIERRRLMILMRIIDKTGSLEQKEHSLA